MADDTRSTCLVGGGEDEGPGEYGGLPLVAERERPCGESDEGKEHPGVWWAGDRESARRDRERAKDHRGSSEYSPSGFKNILWLLRSIVAADTFSSDIASESYSHCAD